MQPVKLGCRLFIWHFYVANDPNEEGTAEAAVLTILSRCTIMYIWDMFDFKIFVGVLVIIYKNCLIHVLKLSKSKIRDVLMDNFFFFYIKK